MTGVQTCALPILNSSGVIFSHLVDRPLNDLIWIEKYQPELTLSMVYFDGESQQYFAKRFKPEELSGKTLIIAEHESSRIELVTSQTNPQIELIFSKVKGQQPNPEIVLLNSFTGYLVLKQRAKNFLPKK